MNFIRSITLEIQEHPELLGVVFAIAAIIAIILIGVCIYSAPQGASGGINALM